MSDDLIKRLRRGNNGQEIEAADRIEELQHLLRVTNEIGMAYEEYAGQVRIKLTKAVEALRMVVGYYNKVNPFRTADYHREDCACDRCYFDDAGTVLAELEGKDEQPS